MTDTHIAPKRSYSASPFSEVANHPLARSGWSEGSIDEPVATPPNSAEPSAYEVRIAPEARSSATPAIELVLVLGDSATESAPLESSLAESQLSRHTGATDDGGKVVLTVRLPSGADAGALTQPNSSMDIPTLVQGLLEEITSTLRGRSAGFAPVAATPPLRAGMPEADVDATERLRRLTSKERKVLACLTAGMSAQQLAVELGITVSTARSHIQAIFHKLGVTSQLAAVVLAHNAGWFDQP